MPLLTEFRDIYPDEHTKKLAELFQPTPAELDADRARLLDTLGGLRCFYVICFTNRCGSTFLAHALASEGRIAAAGEALNFEAVRNEAGRHGLKSFAGYLDHVVRRQARDGVFGVKAGPGQLITLYNEGLLHHVADRLVLVHVQRQRTQEQAVSMYIATRTRRWTSEQAGVEADLRYEPQVLVKTLEVLVRKNAAFKALFELFGVEPVPVQYEKLVAEPDKVVRRVGRHLGLPGLRYVAENVPIEKQGDALNEELLRAWTQAYALRPGVRVPSAAAGGDD